MARSIADIKASILAKKAEYRELDVLDSPSATAIWNLWTYIVAYLVHYFETLQDAFKAEIEETIRRGVVGRGEWYVSKAYQFQYGDDLKVIDGVLQYEQIDESKKIIKRASYTKESGTLTKLKVATEDLDGNIQGLSSPQLIAFTDYVNNIMFAGSQITIVSANTDFLRLTATVYYNPLFALDAFKPKVEAAIRGYLKALPFDGIVKVSSLIDAVQAVEGVTDFTIQTIRAKSNAGSYVAVERIYQTVAGYIQIDETNYPLATNLTYVAE